MFLASKKVLSQPNKPKKDEKDQNNPINEEDIRQFDFDTNIGFIKFNDFLTKKTTIQEKIMKCKQCDCFLNHFS